MTPAERPASIRHATAADAPQLIAFLRHMLAEMATLGGHRIATDPAAWTAMEAEIRGHVGTLACLHLLAEMDDAVPSAVGWAFGRTIVRDPVFEPERVLHVHALYVSPRWRRRGIGTALLGALVEWGRSSDCSEAELNVLAGNPARSLYGKLGFDTREVKMTRKL